MAYDLSLEYQLSASPERVMQLLTDAALIRRWSGGEAILENKVGGTFSMFDEWAYGIVKMTSENELAYTWSTTDWDDNTPPTQVHYKLKSHDGGTKVTVLHTGFTTEDDMNSHRTGWSDFFFEPLEDYIMIFDKN